MMRSWFKDCVPGDLVCLNVLIGKRLFPARISMVGLTWGQVELVSDKSRALQGLFVGTHSDLASEEAVILSKKQLITVNPGKILLNRDPSDLYSDYRMCLVRL